MNAVAGLEVGFHRGGTFKKEDLWKTFGSYSVDKGCRQTVVDPGARLTAVETATGAGATKRGEGWTA